MTDIINDKWCFSSGSIIAFCLVTILLHYVIAGYTLQLQRRERLSTTGLVASALVGDIVGTAVVNAENSSSSTTASGSTAASGSASTTSPSASSTTTVTPTKSSMPWWEIMLIVFGGIAGLALLAYLSFL